MMSSDALWRLRVHASVPKKLARFPRDIRIRLECIIDALPENPYAGDIEKIKGEALMWRRRVGSYRIFFELIPAEKVVFVFWVERRTSSMY